MAALIPLEKYIPAGSLCIPVEDLSVACHDVWPPSSREKPWLFSFHSDPAGPDPPHTIPAELEKDLLALPSLAALRKLIPRKWARFSFRTSDENPSLGFVRVYVLPDDECRRVVPRHDLKLRKDLQRLLDGLDQSPESWQGTSSDPRRHTYLRSLMTGNGNSPENGDDMSLLQMFNSIPSPKPQPELIEDSITHDVMDGLVTSKIPGLKSTLYGYQGESASVMLQREFYPGRVLDPRLFKISDLDGRPWYYDDVTGEVLREPRFYDGVSGGILAEEMGTGKTLICLALILATKAFPAEIPEVCRGNIDGTGVETRRRPKVGSLADMAAAIITKESVPWKLYLEDTVSGGVEYSRAIEVIKRNPGQYRLPVFDSLSDRCRSGQNSHLKTKDMFLSNCSLVIVPANLVQQWQQEIAKHTEGLRVLVVAGKHRIPSVEEILDADILLFSIPRFEKMEQDRVVSRVGWDFCSPLASVHFKRVIVDEGHRLGNSKISNKSKLLLVLDSLQVSSRWIVTGTPSIGLFGVDDTAPPTPDSESNGTTTPTTVAPEPSLVKAALEWTMSESKKLGESSGVQEKKDLERIGSMASLYLRVGPWANNPLDVNDTADWAVYVMQPKHSSRSRGRKDCLRATLDSLIIRHRKSEVRDLLPPVVEKVVLLDGSYQDKLCLNLFSMMIIFNAVQSERTDQDYFFHPRQRGALLQLLSNIRQSTFFGAFFYSKDEISKAVETASTYLEGHKDSMPKDDEQLLRDAIAFGAMAKDNNFKRVVDLFHEVPIYVQDFPGGGQFAEAWSISNVGEEGSADENPGEKLDPGSDLSSGLTCTAAPWIHALQKFLRPCIDAPHSLDAMFRDGRFVDKGRAVREAALLQQQQQQAAPPPKSGPKPKPAPTLAGNTRLGEDSSPLKRRSGSLGTPARMDDIPALRDVPEVEIAAPLAKAKIVSTSSAKLSYLIDSIMRYQAEEQIIVFYDNDNVAFYLAEHLEILQIPHLIYARGITTERRVQYVETFSQNAKFRVLLMDISQAAFGLDMRSASRIYFISPVLNPQVEAQAIGRVRRISQKKQVSVETLVLRDSLEEVIMARRQEMTQAEHRKMKSILDDRPIYDWILNAKILPLPSLGHAGGSAQMAPLQTPQFLFGRGFGRVEHPDEGLVEVQGQDATGQTSSEAAGVGGGSSSTAGSGTEGGTVTPVVLVVGDSAQSKTKSGDGGGDGEGDGNRPRKKLKLAKGRVRFGDAPESGTE